MRKKQLIYSLVGILVLAFGGLLATLVAGNTPSLGLDLQGGISITQQPVGDFNTSSLDLAVERIRERVDSLGVAEPEILRQGDAIVVNLPGVKNQAEAEQLVKVTGQVYLRPVLIDDQFNIPCVTSDPNKKPATTTTTTTIAGGSTTTTSRGHDDHGCRWPVASHQHVEHQHHGAADTGRRRGPDHDGGRRRSDHDGGRRRPDDHGGRRHLQHTAQRAAGFIRLHQGPRRQCLQGRPCRWHGRGVQGRRHGADHLRLGMGRHRQPARRRQRRRSVERAGRGVLQRHGHVSDSSVGDRSRR